MSWFKLALNPVLACDLFAYTFVFRKPNKKKANGVKLPVNHALNHLHVDVTALKLLIENNKSAGS